MKCDPQGAIQRQRAKERAEQEKQEQEYITSLTDEERKKYLEEKKKRQEDAWKTLTSIGKFLNDAGIRTYY